MSLLHKVRRLFAAAAGDERGRYVAAERAAARLHPDAILSEKDRVWLADSAFRSAYDRLDARHPRKMDRAWNLREFARWTRETPGETAECGVFEGVSSYFICEASQGTGKEHHGFDSFEGLSTPQPNDGEFWRDGDLSVAETRAQSMLASFTNAHLHKGWIPEQFSVVADKKFSLLHVDVDLYQPTLDSLSFFVPRMSSGSVIVLDDYGFSTCPGARQATDEVCRSHGLRVVELSSGQGLIVL